MWRSVQAVRAGKYVDSKEDDDDLAAKTKHFRSDDSVWIRKGFVVASVALFCLFLLTGFLSRTRLTSEPSNVFKYVEAFNSEVLESGSESEPEEPGSDSWELNDHLEASKQVGCHKDSAKLKVFLYDLPPKFHYGMIPEFTPEESQIWPRNVSNIPRYPGGLYQQHSPEYWLISDLVTSDMPERSTPCTAFRVKNWQIADVILIPFFASLSYNKYSRPAVRGRKKMDRNQELQVNLLSFLRSQPAWRASNGADHVLIIHHPNAMVYKREQFRSAMFVVADFGRYDAEVANIAKDVVAPYKHIIPNFDDDIDSVSSFNTRTTLLFFQGAIVRKEGGIIRQKLYELLRDESDVVFVNGTTTSAGIRSATSGMRQSKFCLHMEGDTPSSNRLFDAVASHCVPLIVSDDIELPFEDVINYTEFCLFVNSSDALRKGFLTNLLRNFGEKEWTRMHDRMREVQKHFEYQLPSEIGDAVQMTWEAIARKVPALTLARNKRRRYSRSELVS
ncbi:probable arabinosyltransferase ARAD1 [Physcomitrium patens]|uniref:Exostosin GT47 domain-containing protein n=1 Tax=Physcomitrium patens TaxID=3218 RepID=A0A2K1J845_PHYPA|nr:probable arabinosyltransferase ARAD1 [Physcomitrium patens]XP_024398480.1 probable arabinosyltransferase ARAD1 [Physcomitrium patens]XP_024398481.1 probable arabinosyltransferase ARAD1 [Physcomitrium patens]PNR37689.1 hypothetical protein PHYPA_020798 [Physcomitrium patens]|eukprot:XP_024398479.1 probable arabinosyltransferase ARAD1 [Physcomitrella patens]